MHVSSQRRLVPQGVIGLCLALGACSGGAPRPVDDGVAIAIAPLTLPNIGKVCYDLRITNAPGGAGETVWSRGTPGASSAGSPDATSICSDAFGDGGGGAISYVAPCDADGQEDADPARERTNVVTLWVDSLYDSAGARIAPDGPDGWRDPCPAGCSRNVVCEENSDALVEFNLTVMRSANQGFFDVAVTFADIFCSAKVDCVDALVIDPASGARVPSVVWAFACTDGDPVGATETTTHLYMDDVILRCGVTAYTIDPSAGPGNLYPGGVGAPAPLVQAMVFEGKDGVSAGGVDADLLFWNVALGLDTSFFAPTTGVAPDCTIETSATAAEGALEDGTTPLDTNYPMVTVAVRINDGADIVCTQHGLDAAGANAGVATAYTGDAPDGSGFARATFGYFSAPTAGGVDTEPVDALVDECSEPSAPCDPNASCIDLAVGFECVCQLGYDGDGATCDDIDACVEAPCGANTSCLDSAPPALGDASGRECTCMTGHSGDPQAGCSNIDACAVTPCGANTSCLDAAPPAPGGVSGRQCACLPGYTGDPQTGCSNIDACAVTPCGANTSCLDAAPPAPGGVSGRQCACLPGYTGDPQAGCSNIDACAVTPCGANTSCLDAAPPAPGGVSGRQCACLPGYTGDPNVGCAQPNGASQAQAGASCLTIKTAYPGSQSNTYYIDPDGGSTSNAFPVWCDMVNDGGGWTLVAKTNGNDKDHVGTTPVNLANLATAATTTSGYIGDANRLTLGTCYRMTCSATTRWARVTNTLSMYTYWGQPSAGVLWSESYSTSPAAYTIQGGDDASNPGHTVGPAYAGRNWARPFNGSVGDTNGGANGCGLYGNHPQTGTMWVKACMP